MGLVTNKVIWIVFTIVLDLNGIVKCGVMNTGGFNSLNQRNLDLNHQDNGHEFTQQSHGSGHGPSGTHVDLPGQHGNESPNPVIHRQSHRSSGTHGSSDTHVDLPGQHGNDSPNPVVHRQSHRSSGTHGSSDTHVDLPGQHGNDSPNPVVHRQSHRSSGTQGSSDTHVDLPGQHGNDSPNPVVHRQSHRSSGTHGSSDTHVDLPGQHGNDSPNPVVHRQSHRSSGTHGSSDTHVDLPGQHGNDSPNPVVHRQSHRSSGTHGSSDTHGDLPGQHGNHSPNPVGHREGSGPTDHGHSINPQTNSQLHVDSNVHIGAPGVRGSPTNSHRIHPAPTFGRSIQGGQMPTLAVPGIPPMTSMGPGFVGPVDPTLIPLTFGGGPGLITGPPSSFPMEFGPYPGGGPPMMGPSARRMRRRMRRQRRRLRRMYGYGRFRPFHYPGHYRRMGHHFGYPLMHYPTVGSPYSGGFRLVF